MKPYIVTVIDRQRKRHRHVAVAHCWYGAWKEAANEYGISALISVRPAS